MRFWDTSAIVPMLIDESGTGRARELFERDSEVAVWWATEVECWSAVMRALRAGRIVSPAEDQAASILATLRNHWFEISPSEEVRREARRLLRIHPLRAADALQLGAALVWAGRYEGYEFISHDERIRDAARLEGFSVI